MSLHIAGGFWNTIRFKLVMGCFIFLVPFIVLIAYNNLYAVNAVREQVAFSNKNIISLYIRQIESDLIDVGKYLAVLLWTNPDVSVIESDFNVDNLLMAKVRLMNKMSEDILIYKSIDALFIYSSLNDEFVIQANKAYWNGNAAIFEDYIRNTLMVENNIPNLLRGKWHVEKIDSEFYLFRILKKGSTYCGAWVRANRLLVPISLEEGNFRNRSILMFVTNQGEPFENIEFINRYGIDLKNSYTNYYLTGYKERFLVVGEGFSEGNFSMISITPEDIILSKLLYIQKVVYLITISIMILMPVYVLLLRKTVLVPMNRLMSVMKSIRKGNLDVRISLPKASEEFKVLNETFNDMVSQIHKLKIDIYEEKINRQKVELERLHLQIKPHFYLNTLNIMNSLAKMKRYELLQEMLLCLAEYLRYMFNSSESFVFLKDELQHVRNYIHIQELRFSQNLCVKIDVEEILLKALVPPLIIHTFVENSIKHAATVEEKFNIFIHAGIVENGNKSSIKITIADSGKGFEEDVLEKIRSGDRIIDEMGEHIGIQNVQKRLLILYNGQASFSCRNGENGGAVVEIVLPFDNDAYGYREGFDGVAACR